MNFPGINFSANNVYGSLKQSYLQLSPLQKKVTWIALAMIGMTAAACCYYMMACCLRDKKIIVEEDSEIPDVVIRPKTPQKPETPIRFTSPLEPENQEDIEVKESENLEDSENLKDKTPETPEELLEEKSIKNASEIEEIESEDEEEFFDAADHWDDESISEEASPQIQTEQKGKQQAASSHQLPKVLKKESPNVIEEEKIRQAPLTPKEEMLSTFQTIWKHASKEEQTCISKIWNTIFQAAEIVSWKKSADKSNEYHLTLKTELQGSYPLVLLPVKAVLKKQIKIAFVEDKILGGQDYRQVIVIREGMCGRFGLGWLAKEMDLEKITIQDEKQAGIFCTVQAKGQTPFEMSTDQALKMWQAMKWNK